jgi:D-alanyl-lipoteichoic acid acyltransferase DltB (MBOAT superfamily)
VNTELANKACAHLVTAPTDATGPATKADLFVYSITTKSHYTSTVFVGIMVNIGVFKKFITGYKQF